MVCTNIRYLKTVTPRFVDVRACLQARVEEFGGGVLEIVAARTDANQFFGNPLPGKKKELRVKYLVVVSTAYYSDVQPITFGWHAFVLIVLGLLCFFEIYSKCRTIQVRVLGERKSTRHGFFCHAVPVAKHEA